MSPINLDFNLIASCSCVEIGWKVAELVSVMEEFICQVTAPDNMQIQGTGGGGGGGGSGEGLLVGDI